MGWGSRLTKKEKNGGGIQMEHQHSFFFPLTVDTRPACPCTALTAKASPVVTHSYYEGLYPKQ